MALMFPKRSAHLHFDSKGELRFYDRLAQKLEDDYLVWYNVPVGRQRRHPDFLILHPDRGLLLLEVKDWSIAALHDISPDSFTVLTQGGLRQHANPLRQARDGLLDVLRILQDDPALQQAEGTGHAGKPVFPWAYGVVFSNITRDQFERAELDRVIPGHLAICRDEMLESVDAEDFQQCLWAMFRHPFRCRLTVPQIDRIRGHLFPDLRVSASAGQFGLFNDAIDTVPDLMKVMDLQQEQLARSLGSGHRIIHGVAGSGKTMILGFRCLQLANALRKPVLVLCYNRTLAARLAAMMAERGLSERVHVRTFHAWCQQMLRSYHLPMAGDDDWDVKTRKWLDTLIAGVDKGHVPRGQYGALMIDEGHDFEPDWYRLVVQMVDPDTNSLLVLYDDAQSIYAKASRRKFTWKSVGIDAVGHTTILRLNYRNTLEVLSVARGFAQEVLQEQSSGDDGVPVINPESAGRRGSMPVLLRCRHQQDELQQLCAILARENDEGRAWSEMAVLCHGKYQIDAVVRALAAAGIPHRAAVTAQQKDSLFDTEDAVRVTTMHSSKGLEFPLVIIPGLGRMPVHVDADNMQTEARLLYVAMTRATGKLWLLHSTESSFTRRLGEVIADVQTRLAA